MGNQTSPQEKSRVPRLPQELLQSVSENLGNDKPSLLSLCLTSHEWLAPAQRQLYRTVHLTIHRPLLFNLFSFSSSPPLPPISGFTSFLEANPHIQIYVQALILSMGGPPDEAKWELPVTELALLFPKLPKLRNLSLLDFSLPANDLVAGFPTVQLDKLVLHGLHATWKGLQYLFSICSPQATLEIVESHLTDDRDESSPSALTLSLKSLKILRPLALGALGFFALPNLASLGIDCEIPADIEGLISQLESSGRTVQSLRFNIMTMDSGMIQDCLDQVESFTPPLRLACPSLEVLCIGLLIPWSPFRHRPLGQQDALNAVTHILSSLPKTVHTLTLGMFLKIQDCEFSASNDHSQEGEGVWGTLLSLLNSLDHIKSIRFLGVLDDDVGHSQNLRTYGQGGLTSSMEDGWDPLVPPYRQFFSQRFGKLEKQGVLSFS